MSAPLAAGLLLCAPLPWLTRHLHRTALRLNGVVLPVVAAGRSEGSAGRDSSPAPIPPVVRVVEKTHPPDRPPVVTPPVVKAGPVRRVALAPPCHNCRCCRAQDERIAASERENDRLRAELEADDARRINQRSTVEV